jgi:hypothetical protein
VCVLNVVTLCSEYACHVRREDTQASDSSSIDDMYRGDVYVTCMWIELRHRIVESDQCLMFV